MGESGRLEVRRILLYAFGGWAIPGVIALPLAAVHEAAGGESAILAGGAWLLVLGPIGCLFAGALVGVLGGQSGDLGSALMIGLGVVALAVVPIMAIDEAITVLTIGAAALILIVPMLVAFVVGFAGGALSLRPSDEASPPDVGHDDANV